jgi:putative ABC transport system permease protein
MIARLMAIVARVTALGRRRRLDRDLEDDLQAHFDLLVDDLIARGMEPAAARREARLRFGTTASAMDAHRDARGSRLVETFARDVGYALRVLRRQPWLTAAVVLILAVGIAVPATALSLLGGFLFREPVSRDPAAFARVIRPGRTASSAVSAAEYEAFRSQSVSFRELAAWSSRPLTAPLGANDPSLVDGQLVSCNFLRLLGVDVPVAGRLLADEDCRAGVPSAVISEKIWRLGFGGDPSVVGRTIRYGRAAIVVVGVAAVPPFIDQWDDPDLVGGVWLPYTARPSLSALLDSHGHSEGLEVAGLLAPGITRAAAAAELQRIRAGLPVTDRERQRPLALSDGTRWATVDADDAWSIFLMALTLPLLVTVMACVNAAALLLSRAVSRQQEMAIRRALGTSRSGLLRMLLTEHLVIAAIAGVASLAIVYALPPLIVWQFDVATTFGALDTLGPDWRVFAGIAIAVVLAAALSGLTPAREALRPHSGDSLLARLGTLGRQRARSRRAFAAVQLAACMVPLVVAVTFARAAERYTRIDFARGDLIVAEVSTGRSPAMPLSEIADRVAAVPGIAAVTYVDSLPLIFEGAEWIRIPGQTGDAVPVRSQIGPQFFDVFGIPILSGRQVAFAAAEQPGPVVVSRQFARRFFSETSALGQVLEVGREVPGGPPPRRVVIAGIAGDRPTGLAMTSRALTDGSILYAPMSPAASEGTLVIRPSAPVAVAIDALAPLLRDVVGMPVPITTFQQRLEDRAAPVRSMQMLLSGLGGVALVLALIGVVGGVAFDVNQRRKELAVQMALGAGPWVVRRAAMRSGTRLMPIGLAFGLLASWSAVRGAEYLRMLPLGSIAADPMPYALVTAFLITVGGATLVAIAYPAGLRDPLPALRED